MSITLKKGEETKPMSHVNGRIKMKSIQIQKVNPMKELLKAGQVLGREEMKKVMAGSGGCNHECSVGFPCCCSTGSSQWLGCYHSATRCCEACLGAGNC